MKNILHVSRTDIPTYFDFTKKELLDLLTLTDLPAIEFQENIKNKLSTELKLLCPDSLLYENSLIALHDKISAFLGSSDVIVEDK